MTATLDLARIAKGPEGQYLERKSLLDGEPRAKRPRDRATVRLEIAEVVAAFANTDGGTLLLGIEDDGTVTGHAYPDDAVSDMLLVPERRLQPPGHAGHLEQLDGKPVLVFDVAMAASAVMVTGNGYPVRQGESCVKMTADRINAWKQVGLVESWEARSSALSLGDLDPKLLALVDILAREHSHDTADYLLRRRLADERAGQLVLRRAAELLFARAPEKIDHPNACVRIFRVMGTERKTGALHNVEDLPRIEGAIPHVLEATFATIDPLLRRPKRLRGTTFEDAPEYPTFAWREAIVNAVAHRDYAIQGRGVEVWLFDDRMEIESPGGVVDAVSLDDLRGGRRAHASRNPRLSRVLVDLGYMREQGEGIPRMFGEMTAQFLPPPTVEGAGKTFKVTLRNTPNITPATAEWLGNIAKEGLSEPQVRALVLALQHGSVSNAELRDATGLDTLTASKALRDLRDRGLLAMRDSGSLTSYVLTQVARGAVARTGGLGPDTGGLGPDTGGLGPDTGGLRSGGAGKLPSETGKLPPETGKLPSETGKLSPETGKLPPETGNLTRAQLLATLPPVLRTRLETVPRGGKVRNLVRDLCALRPWRRAELATLLDRKSLDHLSEKVLAPLVADGALEMTIPDRPNDPNQAYRATKKKTGE